MKKCNNFKEYGHYEKECVASQKGKGREEKSLEEKMAKVLRSQNMDMVLTKKRNDSTS